MTNEPPIIVEVRFCLGFHGSRKASETFLIHIPGENAMKWVERRKETEPWLNNIGSMVKSSIDSLFNRRTSFDPFWKSDNQTKSTTRVPDDDGRVIVWKTVNLLWKKKTGWEGFSHDDSKCATPVGADEFIESIIADLSAGFGTATILERNKTEIDESSLFRVFSVIEAEALSRERGRLTGQRKDRKDI